MTKTFRNVGLSQVGLAQDCTYLPCIIDTTGMDVVSVTAVALTAWATAVVELKYGDTPEGPFGSYTTAATMTTSDKTTGLQSVIGRYAAIEVTTLEANVRADLIVTLKGSGLAQAVGT